MSNQFGPEYFKLIKSLEGKQRFLDELELVYALMPPQSGDKILDVGCGTGRLGLFLLKRQNDIEVVFSDFSEEAAKYVGGAHRFERCMMEETPFKDEEFDLVYCLHTISHTVSPENALREVARITKRGGKICIITFNKHYMNYMKLYYRVILRKPYERDTTAKYMFYKNQLASLAEKTGWKVTRKITFGPFPSRFTPFNFMRWHIMMVAEKKS